MIKKMDFPRKKTQFYLKNTDAFEISEMRLFRTCTYHKMFFEIVTFLSVFYLFFI